MFENEIIDTIRQYNSEIEIVDNELLGKTVYVCSKNITFHLLPIPFPNWQNISSSYFQEKSLEYASRGVQLVHLWQDCWTVRQAIVRSRIAMISGSSERLHARKTYVRKITRDIMFDFFATNHLQSFVDARYNYGLYSEEQLLAAASFSAGRNFERNGVKGRSFELVRYANLLHHRVAGGLSKLIARFIKDINPDDIMTYADLDWASGKGYKALNFKQTNVTPPQTFWIHPAEMIRYYPYRMPVKQTNEYLKQKTYSNIDDFFIDKGYVKIYNAGNLKYLLVIGY